MFEGDSRAWAFGRKLERVSNLSVFSKSIERLAGRACQSGVVLPVWSGSRERMGRFPAVAM